MVSLVLAVVLGQFSHGQAVAEPFARRPIPLQLRVQRDSRDDRIAQLEAEVARLQQKLSRQAEAAPGEWRPYGANSAYEVYGREINGQFHFIAYRKKR